MARKFIDCREMPSESNCSVAISADWDKGLLEAAVQHAVAIHRHGDLPKLRKQLMHMFQGGSLPVERVASRVT